MHPTVLNGEKRMLRACFYGRVTDVFWNSVFLDLTESSKTRLWRTSEGFLNTPPRLADRTVTHRAFIHCIVPSCLALKLFESQM